MAMVRTDDAWATREESSTGAYERTVDVGATREESSVRAYEVVLQLGSTPVGATQSPDLVLSTEAASVGRLKLSYVEADLPRLTPAESAVFNDLRDNRLQAQLRLEQERISFGWLQRALAALASTHSLDRPRFGSD